MSRRSQPGQRFSQAANLEGRELLKRLRVHFPALFPDDLQDLRPWALKEDAHMRQALAEAEDGERVSGEVWRAAMSRWFNIDLKRREAYLEGLTAGAPRYDMHGNVSGSVCETEAAYAALCLTGVQARRKLKARSKACKAGGQAKENSQAAHVSRCSQAGQRRENGMTEGEPLADRIWRQVEHGIDEDLLPTREKRTRDLAKKMDRDLDKNGWRMFVSGCVCTIANGKGPQRRNAEVVRVDTVRRWRDQVVDLLPERADPLKRIVEAGLERPEPPPRTAWTAWRRSSTTTPGYSLSFGNG